MDSPSKDFHQHWMRRQVRLHGRRDHSYWCLRLLPRREDGGCVCKDRCWKVTETLSQYVDRTVIFVCRDTSESEEKSQKLRSPRGSALMCVTVRMLCLLVSSVSVILSVARAAIHDMLHLMVHPGCDPFQITPQSHKMVMMSVPHLSMVAEP